MVFTPVMRTYYSIGLLYKIFGDDSQCAAYLKQVYRKCVRYLPEEDRKTITIKSMLTSMGVGVEDDDHDNDNENQNQNSESELD